jgi:prevent-host-death family protein
MTELASVSSREAREKFSTWMNKVYFTKKPLLVKYHDEPRVVIIPAEDFEAYKTMHDSGKQPDKEARLAAIKKAQDIVRRVIPDRYSLADELIQDRRNEVAREHKNEKRYEQGSDR